MNKQRKQERDDRKFRKTLVRYIKSLTEKYDTLMVSVCTGEIEHYCDIPEIKMASYSKMEQQLRILEMQGYIRIERVLNDEGICFNFFLEALEPTILYDELKRKERHNGFLKSAKFLIPTLLTAIGTILTISSHIV